MLMIDVNYESSLGREKLHGSLVPEHVLKLNLLCNPPTILSYTCYIGPMTHTFFLLNNAVSLHTCPSCLVAGLNLSLGTHPLFTSMVILQKKGVGGE